MLMKSNFGNEMNYVNLEGRNLIILKRATL